MAGVRDISSNKRWRHHNKNITNNERTSFEGVEMIHHNGCIHFNRTSYGRCFNFLVVCWNSDCFEPGQFKICKPFSVQAAAFFFTGTTLKVAAMFWSSSFKKFIASIYCDRRFLCYGSFQDGCHKNVSFAILSFRWLWKFKPVLTKYTASPNHSLRFPQKTRNMQFIKDN